MPAHSSHIREYSSAFIFPAPPPQPLLPPLPPHRSHPPLPTSLHISSLCLFPVPPFRFIFFPLTFPPCLSYGKSLLFCASILLITEASVGTPPSSIVINNDGLLNKTGRGNMQVARGQKRQSQDIRPQRVTPQLANTSFPRGSLMLRSGFSLCCPPCGGGTLSGNIL